MKRTRLRNEVKVQNSKVTPNTKTQSHTEGQTVYVLQVGSLFAMKTAKQIPQVGTHTIILVSL